MDYKQYTEYRKQMDLAIQRRRFNEAIALCRAVVSETDSVNCLRQSLERQAETYGLLSGYALDGFEDPSRDEQTAIIGQNLEKIMDLAAREIKLRDSNTLYYSTLRYLRKHPEESIEAVVVRCRDCQRKYGNDLFVDPDGMGNSRRSKAELENVERELFTRIWISGLLSDADAALIRNIFADEVSGRRLKSLVAGALFLGLLELFDPVKAGLLLDAYETHDPTISTRALAYMLVALTMVDKASLEKASMLKPRLAILADEESWRRDVTEVFRQLLISRDTDRITRKMNDEIIPKMKDMGRDLTDLIKERGGNPLDIESMDDAEQWQQLLDDAGVADKMREMSEIQEEGGDVMMTTFAHLKDFQFFKNVANWFVPFESDHTSLPVTHVARRVAEMLENAPMLCDSDKYSMVLSLGRVPAAQQDFLASQLESQARQLDELQAASLGLPVDKSRNGAVNVVRNLYRFFKLFSRAGEFANPFDTSLNLMTVPFIKDTIDRQELQQLASDFYFTHGYYDDAFPLLREMESTVAPGSEAELYFRIGECLRHRGDFQQALVYLERSELFDEKRRSTLVELGHTYRAVGNSRKAYEAFRRANDLLRDGDSSLQLLMAAELIDMERYEEALELLYRVEYLYGLTPVFTRRLAQCEMMLGHYERCNDHLGHLDHLSPDDMVMHAVIETAARHYRDAVERLRTAMKLNGGIRNAVIDKFDSYSPLLQKAGVDKSVLDIIKDNI